jgi:hypothetical protein
VRVDGARGDHEIAGGLQGGQTIEIGEHVELGQGCNGDSEAALRVTPFLRNLAVLEADERNARQRQ